MEKQQYTPALGTHERTADYDKVIAVMTRERRWRGSLLRELSPQTGETIVDLGSGTGSMAILIKTKQPDVRMIGIDPDPEVRKIAETKAEKAGIALEFHTAMGDSEIPSLASSSADKVISSLVLHQCPIDVKRAIIANAFRLLKPKGRLLIADFGKQKGLLMQLLFNQVRATDGYEDTKPNKDGMIPVYMREAGFRNVEETGFTQTPTGTISLYSGYK